MSDLDWANYTDFKVGSHMTDRDYLVYHYSKEGYARYLYLSNGILDNLYQSYG